MKKMNSGKQARFPVYALVFLLLAGISTTLWFANNQKAGADILSPEERAWLDQHPGIHLAPDPSFPPIESFDKDGGYTGMMADIFKDMQDNLHYQFTIVRLENWDAVLKAARDREVDGITAAQVTPERSKYLLFSQTIVDIPNVIIVRADVSGQFSFTQMSGMRVAVTKGYALQEFIQSSYPNIVLDPVNDDLAALHEVSFKRADAAVVNLAIASYLIEKHGITNLRVAGDSGKSNSLYIATRSDQPVLNQIMQKGLASIREDERKTIYNRWIRLGTQNFWESSRFWQISASILGSLALVFLVSFGWVVSLKKQVKARTQELNQQLAERKLVEEALRASDAFRKRVFESSLIPIVVMDAETYQYIDCNPAAVEIYRFTSREETLGKTPLDVSAPMQYDGTPSSEKARYYIARALAEGRVVFEWRHQRPNGETWDAEVHLMSFKSGAHQLLQFTLVDTSERKRAEEKLKYEMEFSQTLIQSSPAYFVAIQADGKTIIMNESMLDALGYTLAEVVGADYLDMFVPEREREMTAGIFEQIITQKHSTLNENHIMARGGREILVEWHGSPVYEGDVFEYFFGVGIDITERRRAEERIETQVRRLAALREIDMAINSSQDLRVMINTVIEQAVAELHVDGACVFILNNNQDALECIARKGFNAISNQCDHLPVGKNPVGRAVQERCLVHVPDLAVDGVCQALVDEGFVTCFAAPLIAKGKVKGAIAVFQRQAFIPDQEWLNFLETLAGQAAIAIDNVNLFQGLQQSNLDLALAYDATIEGWSRALDLRDKETEGHSQRVMDMSLALAVKLGVCGEELVHIRRGALLHDIGKMGVPDRILLKPDKLTDEECMIMRRHPQYANDMLASIDYLRPALDIPCCHHEKWDGTGYPHGLKGEQIPLAARIFALVDVWDALTSDRPYRPAWTEANALEYIIANAETHFDPKIVSAFLDLVYCIRKDNQVAPEGIRQSLFINSYT